jgi:hypothetical protein
MIYIEIFVWLAASKKFCFVQFELYVKWLLNFTHMIIVFFWVITQPVVVISYPYLLSYLRNFLLHGAVSFLRS